MKALRGLAKRPAGVLATLLLVAAAMTAAWADTPASVTAPTLSVEMDKTTVTVGERLWLTLRVRLPEGARLPATPDVSGLENLTVVERSVHDNTVQLALLADRLESFKTGPIGVTYLDADGKEQEVETDPLAVTVRSNLGKQPESATLRPIQDILPGRPPWITYLLWGAGGCLLAGLVVVGVWWWRKRNRPQTVAAEVVDPPHVRAEREIDQLETGGLFERGEVKAFYFCLSEILRRYLESIRDFPAAEMTVEEIARQAGHHPRDRELLPLLRRADLVKFADALPSPAGKDEDVQGARTYIRQTAPAPENPPAAASPPEAGP